MAKYSIVFKDKEKQPLKLTLDEVVDYKIEHMDEFKNGDYEIVEGAVRKRSKKEQSREDVKASKSQFLSTLNELQKIGIEAGTRKLKWSKDFGWYLQVVHPADDPQFFSVHSGETTKAETIIRLKKKIMDASSDDDIIAASYKLIQYLTPDEQKTDGAIIFENPLNHDVDHTV
jgi:hypothetical protein